MASISGSGLFVADGSPEMSAYSVCYLDPKHVVPVAVEVIDAFDDREAVLVAKSRRQFLVREVWHRHRLVATIGSA